jgi:type IV pilus assembly protein PilQ
MFSQSRVRSAIKRTTLVLSLVSLSATGVLAATKNVELVVIGDSQSQGPQTSAAAPMPTPPVGMTRAVDKQSDQGRQYGQPGFVGEPINLNVVNADIRDILNYITEQYGVNFVIDSSVSAVPVTVNVQDVPWNIALDAVLKANRLGIETNGNILRVATTDVLAKEAETQKVINDSRLDASPLVTEFIRLNYARASGTLGPGSRLNRCFLRRFHQSQF